MGTEMGEAGAYGPSPEELTRTRVPERLLEREDPDQLDRLDDVDMRRLVWACRGLTPGTFATRAKRARTDVFVSVIVRAVV
jgi:hypothetical protein